MKLTVARTGPRSAASSRWLVWSLRLLVAAPVAWLVVFHAALLGRRWADQSLLDPLVGLKWLASAALITTLPLLRRAGIRLAEPRRAAALGVLVLLLHVALPTPSAATPLAAEAPVPVGWALLAAMPTAIGLAWLGLLLLAGRTCWVVAPTPRGRARTEGRRRPGLPGAKLQLFSRPPPALSAA